MILINYKRKLDPIVKLKLKEKSEKFIPVIITLREVPSGRFKNSISKNRGTIKYELKFMNALSASLSIEDIDRICQLPEVHSISYDRKAEVCMDKAASSIGLNYSKPYNLTGKGVNIAIIDTGVFPHPDLLRPYKVISQFVDLISSSKVPYDDNGHGTFMSGVIAGSGSMSDGRYRGIAPNSKVIMLKAFNSVGQGSFSDILSAIGWVVENKEKYNIKILVLPFGAESIVPCNMDPLCKACEIASNAKITVITSSGNRGPNVGTVTTPGISTSVVTAGCCNCSGLDIKDWKIPDFSGRGSKLSDSKPDLVAPGSSIISLQADKKYSPEGKRLDIPSIKNDPYCTMTGSSVSTAVTAGCIALLLEKMPDLNYKDLKGILKLSCRTLNESKTSQGFGIITIERLLS